MQPLDEKPWYQPPKPSLVEDVEKWVRSHATANDTADAATAAALSVDTIGATTDVATGPAASHAVPRWMRAHAAAASPT